MTLRNLLLLNCFAFGSLIHAQNFKGVYKIDQLIHRIQSPDTTYVVNFWATWCKPCVEEISAFDSLSVQQKKQPVKVLLVSVDFKEDLDKLLKPFLIKHGLLTECILLDEVNGNDFINKISPGWSGAIPATLFKKGNTKKLVERKMMLADLQRHLAEMERTRSQDARQKTKD